MIITKKWLNEFINLDDVSTENICLALNSIGLEVDNVKKINIPNGIKIGFVKSCEQHPDANKLKICQVDLGNNETVQIVCGAKNISKGQHVPVATIGSVLNVYQKNIESKLSIKETTLRGILSCGMICSSSEIGLFEANDGILVLDDSIGELIIGKNLNSYELLNDELIEIELTANRGDCLSIRGIARDLGAYFGLKLKSFNFKINHTNTTIGEILNVSTDSILTSQLMISSADFTNFQVPVLISLRSAFVSCYNKNELLLVGNYVTHSIGTLYDFTAQKLEQDDYGLSKLTIKKDENNFESFYGSKKISTIGIDVNNVLLDKNNENAKKVIIICLYVNPDYISQKVFESKIKTGDVFYKSSRGTECDLEFGSDYIHYILSSCKVLVHKSSRKFLKDRESKILSLSLDTITSIIGEKIDTSRIIKILELLDFRFKGLTSNLINVQIPCFRHDIKNVADVTEEIVRIIGIDNIQAKPLKIEEKYNINDTSNLLDRKNEIRLKSISNGFYEAISYVFSSKESLKKYNFPVVSINKDIANPISKELNTLRTTILVNLVEAVSRNYKYGYNHVALFEYGIVFDTNRIESNQISFIHSGFKENYNLSNSGKPDNMDLFTFASKISNIIGDFKLEPIEKLDNNFMHPYQSAKIIMNKVNIGFISKLHPNVSNDYNISDTFIAQIDFDNLIYPNIKATNISKFQSSKRDLSIVVNKNLQFDKIKSIIDSLNIEEIKKYDLIDIYSDESLIDDESLTIRFVLQHNDKTMEDGEITEIMDQIFIELKNKLNIKMR